jgi:transcription antitermination factor NusG
MSFAANGPTMDIRWYAITTRSRHEKTAAAMLDALGVINFFPVSSELRQWSDRKRMVDFPLFPGYLFVRVNPGRESTLPILKTPGIVGFVGNQYGPSPIPDFEIDAVRRVLAEGTPCAPHPFLQEGDRVRVIRGALTGLKGTLVRAGSRTELVISIEMISRSVAVRVSREDVEPVVSGGINSLNASRTEIAVGGEL